MRIVPVAGWFLAAQLVLATLSFAAETDVDRLLEFLIKEKVITQEKATEFRADLAIKKQEEKQPAVVPDWVQNTKIKGDFRLREEWRKDKSKEDLTRTRIRVRLGIESKVNDKLKVGVGIATGAAGDPRSRDITLGGDGSNTPGDPKSVVLDYAYAEYRPLKWLTLTGGKFQNPLWRPHDMLWKSDITPEGLGFNLNYKVGSKLELFMNDLIFILSGSDTQGTSREPMLYAIQPGFSYNFNDKVSLKSAFTYNYFNGVLGNAQFKKSSNTNTLVNSVYAFNYNSINPSVELGFKGPFGDFPILKSIPYFGLFGDFIYNVSPGVTTSKSGFDAGVKFGAEKVAGWGDWQAKLAYSKLGRDAWLDVFTDSSRFQGRTNTKGITASVDYGLGKNTWLTAKYYNMNYLTKDYQGLFGTAAQIGGYAPEQLLQIDWNMKF